MSETKFRKINNLLGYDHKKNKSFKKMKKLEDSIWGQIFHYNIAC